jgi:hypothetical protein
MTDVSKMGYCPQHQGDDRPITQNIIIFTAVRTSNATNQQVILTKFSENPFSV